MSALSDSGSTLAGVPWWLTLALIALAAASYGFVSWLGARWERQNRECACRLCDTPGGDVCPRCRAWMRDAYTHERKDQP